MNALRNGSSAFNRVRVKGDWHSVIAGYDEAASFLAINGVMTNGPGIALGDSMISNAFYVGSTEGFWTCG